MDRRTALVTAASITGVIITGAVAVGANIHILGQSDESGVGELSASSRTETIELVDLADATDVTENTLEPIDGLTEPSTVDGSETYLVEDAGSVEVIRRDGAVLLGRVEPADGWTWTVGQGSPDHIDVTFASAATSYVFTAVVDDDGRLDASVSEPIPAPTPPPAAAPVVVGDDGHGEHEDDGHEASEHEGREDDD